MVSVRSARSVPRFCLPSPRFAEKPRCAVILPTHPRILPRTLFSEPYEVIQMTRKERVRWFPKGDVTGRILFIRQIPGLTAA